MHAISTPVVEHVLRRVKVAVVIIVGLGCVKIVATAVGSAGDWLGITVWRLGTGTLSQGLIEVGCIEDAAVATLVGLVGREVRSLRLRRSSG